MTTNNSQKGVRSTWPVPVDGNNPGVASIVAGASDVGAGLSGGRGVSGGGAVTVGGIVAVALGGIVTVAVGGGISVGVGVKPSSGTASPTRTFNVIHPKHTRAAMLR
jgi:hypothetical protein